MESTWLYTSFSLFLLLLTYKLWSTPRCKLPPSPTPALPVIGHLHLLKQPLHRTLHSLSEKLGPIFSLRFGNRLVVVVSSPTAAEECFTKNDIVLANRPRFAMGKYIGYNYTSLVTAPYGEHWRNLRRLCSVEILSSSRLNLFLSIRQDEIKRLLQKLYKTTHSDFAKVELKSMLSEFSFNIIMKMVSGKRYLGEDEQDNEEEKRFQELINQVFELGGVSNPGDFLPLFRWIDYGGYEEKTAKLCEKTDAFFQGLIDEHRRYRSGNSMIDHLLYLQESQPEYYSDTIIKGIIMAMLTAGTDTSSVTIEWALSILLNNPGKLEKAKDEIDRLVGNDSFIEESDLPKLRYFQNVISETFRLFPAAPLLVPHESSDNCKIGEYDIPRGTILLFNAWAIHRDPTIWDDPTSFKPERFEIGEDGPPKLMPFGMGRRSCPGASLAERVVGLALGSLVQCFEWQRIDEENIDLTEGTGLTMPKAVPLEAMCKARNILHKDIFTAA